VQLAALRGNFLQLFAIKRSRFLDWTMEKGILKQISICCAPLNAGRQWETLE
jgi:hypothetical protein